MSPLMFGWKDNYIEAWTYGGNELYSPIDYVSFEFSDDGGITWINPDWGSMVWQTRMI